MLNQRQATVSTIINVLKERGVNYELNGAVSVSEVLTDSDKQKVRDQLFHMFRAGKVQYSVEFASKVNDDKELKSYISGLTNNWIRKATEFNSGTKYQAKNPGSRQGSSDDQIKEMKLLLSVTTDPEARKLIEKAIEARISEIKPEKKTSIDLDKIPEALRAQLGL